MSQSGGGQSSPCVLKHLVALEYGFYFTKLPAKSWDADMLRDLAGLMGEMYVEVDVYNKGFNIFGFARGLVE